MKTPQSMALLFLLILMPLSGSTQTSGENDEQQVMSVLDDFMTTFSNSDLLVMQRLTTRLIFDSPAAACLTGQQKKMWCRPCTNFR